MVQAAGAKEVHLRISCPPTFAVLLRRRYAEPSELIAATHTLDEIRELRRGRQPAYLSLDGLLRRSAPQQNRTARPATPASIRSRSRGRAGLPAARAEGGRLRADHASLAGARPGGCVASSASASSRLRRPRSVAATARRRAAQAPPPAQLKAAIDKLGKFDFPDRGPGRARPFAARPRRSPSRRCSGGRSDTPTATSGSARSCCSRASTTRARATSWPTALAERTIACGRSPTPFSSTTRTGHVPRLLERSRRRSREFVRPALTRALAAHGEDRKSRQAMKRLVMRGQDFFRSAVIEALGDYRARLRARRRSSRSRSSTARCRTMRRWRWGRSATSAALDGAGGTAANGAARARSRRSPPRSACSASTAARTRSYLVDSLTFAIANTASRNCCARAARALAALAASGRAGRRGRADRAGAPTRDPARRRLRWRSGRSRCATRR